MPIEKGRTGVSGQRALLATSKKDWMVQGNQIVDFGLRQTTIRCAELCPAEVAKVQRRAKAGRTAT